MKYDNLITPNFDGILLCELTGETIQDGESLGDYYPRKNQLYFFLNNDKQVIGLREIFRALEIGERKGELPPIDREWWRAVKRRYQID